ncbi:thioredoxin-disulfide reductase [Candidatus Contubernalis alkalaceticus]|nr:thioredoxin-disulfide reductase [Candidatus Contubernalis alkalaceticus]
MLSLLYDVIIIGGGPAALTAAIYASRAKLSTLVIEKMVLGGTIVISEKVNNYPGFPQDISGYELGKLFEEQAKNFGAEIKWKNIVRFEDRGDVKAAISEKEEFLAKSVIIATGTSHKSLGVPGEENFIGRGISFCATCDAPLFRNKKVLVVGGGNAALQEAIFTTQFAEKVYIAHRGENLRAEKDLQEQASENEKIEFLWNTVVKEVKGENLLEKVLLRDNVTGEEWMLEVGGMLIYIGVHPNTYFLEDSEVEMDEEGYIITNEKMETSIAGVYAAGDVRQKKVRQVITAAADGAVAANLAKSYLKKRKS